MSTTDSLKDTIVPKSDQLNADDLLCGPITVTVQSVKRGESKEQPVIIGIGPEHQPYKPCKSMRRVLIAAWGDKGADWVGKSMTLYTDPNVVFGGVRVGGIRISHLSHIDADRTFMLTASRGKKADFLVKRLVTNARSSEEVYQSAKQKIADAKTVEALSKIQAGVEKSVAGGTFSQEQADTLLAKITKRTEELEAATAAST